MVMSNYIHTYKDDLDTPVLTATMYNLKKLTYEQRKERLIKRLNALNSAAGNGDEEDEDYE
ncbi:hypothetical protein RJ639_028234 [Escallonia herrerae]|uniref:Large ribosomal subunit protein uL18 C-terminal eukaryotes domain-containing protein n=1 Tax=Escallonia herrerae TaxID=1293975 RepID=A0AA89BQ40_9ASTE|nr:hypothetical protein RJ639_028234 [Escallonia herrerae]